MQSDFQNRLPALMKELAVPPGLCLHQINPAADSGLVIEADPGFYRKAVFLDQRALSEDSLGM